MPEREVAPSPTSPGRVHVEGPGCKAADACLLVHGYLVNLAEGKTGFGVLKIAKERLEQGATAASQLGQAQLAQEMRTVSQDLPEVHTAEQAAALVPTLKALCDQTWELGRRCGALLSPERIQQARVLGPKVRTGEISRDQAVAELRRRDA
jgi:hypothetical protein